MNIIMPSLGENVTEGTITNILVNIGDVIENGQTLIEVETDKVNFEVPAEVAGKLVEIFVKKGEKIKPGELILILESAKTEIEVPKPENFKDDVTIPQSKLNDQDQENITYSNPKIEVSLEGESKRILSTPLARKLARELGIELNEIEIHNNKRILFNDVKIFAKKLIKEKSKKDTFDLPEKNTPLLPNFEKFGNVRRQEMSSIMMATSRNMMVSTSNIPHAWIHEKVDITALEEQRKKHKGRVELSGGSLTITALVVLAVYKSLRAFPILNTSLDLENNELVFKEFINIGVAVDSDRGLLVPVIRNVDKRNLTEIAVELSRLSKEAKERKTKLEDLEGATFTISNLGGIGTTNMCPLINWPQVSILGISASQIEPVWMENEFAPRLRLPFSLGFDHRIINGADATRFLQHIKIMLEEPFLFLL